MAKPVVRIGIDVDAQTWKTLLKVKAFEGVRTYDFLIDSSERTVWLYLVGESEEVLGRLHDVATKAGGLPMKSGGEWPDSAESYGQYLQAEFRAVRLELRMKQAEGGPETDHLALKEDYAAAIRARDLARASFDAAVKQDTRRRAETKEMFEEDEIVFEHLGTVN